MLLCHLILVYVKNLGKSSGRRFAADLNVTIIHLPHNFCKLKPAVSGISSAKVIINARSGMSDKEEVRRRLAKIFEANKPLALMWVKSTEESFSTTPAWAYTQRFAEGLTWLAFCLISAEAMKRRQYRKGK